MRYVKISELKKDAKKARKENTALKNHSESLNYIANQYGKIKWEDLLDSSVFILELKSEESYNDNELFKEPCGYLKSLINELSDIISEREEILASGDYREISQYLSRGLIYTIEDKDVFRTHAKFFIDLISLLYVNRNKKIHPDFNYFLEIFDYDFLIKEIKNNIQDYEKNNVVKAFFRYCLLGTNLVEVELNRLNGENDFGYISQFHFVSSIAYTEIENLIFQYNIFKKSNKLNILKDLNVPQNTSTFFSMFKYNNDMLSIIEKYKSSLLNIHNYLEENNNKSNFSNYNNQFIKYHKKTIQIMKNTGIIKYSL